MILKIGDILLWHNGVGREEFFGEYSIAVIQRFGKGSDDFYLKFPDNTVPQYMDLRTIKRNSKIITKEKNPEYFL